MSKHIAVAGTFVDFKWVNPHAIIRFNVTNKRGEAELWAAETHGSAVLARFGWRPDMFKPGEKLSLSGNPARKDGRKVMNVLSVTTSGGKTYNVQRSN